MILVRTPLRLEFLGGGTDMEYFYSKHPGRVLNAALDKYIYLSINPTFGGEIRVRYSKNERVPRANQVKHTRVRAALEHFGIEKGIEIASIADIPYGSGLGSSGSFTVGLVQGLYHYLGKSYAVRQVAEVACHLEIDILGEPIGKQDQYAAAFGGLNLMTFRKNGNVVIKPLLLKPTAKKLLENHLLLVYTGTTRSASNILQIQKQNLEKKIAYLRKMANIALEGTSLLESGNLKGFARILEKEWEIKKNLAPISSYKIERMYKKAIQAGAWGGRISGAGGGGFMILIAPQKKHPVLKSTFRNHIFLEPKLEDGGSQVVFET